MIDTSLSDLFCLTMHYVEYHVLMAPRAALTFRSTRPAPPTASLGSSGATGSVFYAMIVLVAGVANFMMISTTGNATNTRLDFLADADARVMLAMFNGLSANCIISSRLSSGSSAIRSTESPSMPLYFSPTAQKQSNLAVIPQASA